MQQGEDNTQMISATRLERRNRGERRIHQMGPKFPLVDCNGIEVDDDRRKTPDRRINNIIVEEVPVDYDLNLLDEF